MLIPILGVLLVLLLGVDVFLTVFHPQGRGGPVTRGLSRLIWGCTRFLGRGRDGSNRDPVLALGGPVIVVATLAVWVTLLVVAFSLIYYPWVRSFLVSPGALRTPWLEALYYSGYTAATLGLGDVIADSEALRIVTVVQAFGGFALLSVSMTYFLAIYRELISMQSLAEDIAGLFVSGEEQVVAFTREEGYDALARWCEQLSSDLTRVLLAHFQYPVLHYFRPQRSSRALPVQLGALLRLRGLVDADASSPVLSTVGRHPSYQALMNGLDSYLKDVDRLFVPDSSAEGDVESTDEIHRAHARLLDYMRYA